MIAIDGTIILQFCDKLAISQELHKQAGPANASLNAKTLCSSGAQSPHSRSW
jgi:hypothetical protein